MSDVVQERVAILPMLNRFGIRLGLGDATISEICERRQIDTAFFLHILNSYLDTDYLGRVRIAPQHTILIADYLSVTNRYFLESQFPNIKIHVNSFAKRSGGNNPLLNTIPSVLKELEEALKDRIRIDEELVPRFRELAARLADNISAITVEYHVDHEEEEDRAEILVSDVMQLMIRHLRGEFNDNLLHAVLHSLSMLRNDLSSNDRLKNRVFLPMMTAMEEALKKA